MSSVLSLRKSASALLAALLLLSSGVSLSAYGTRSMRGDVNGDRLLTAADYVMMKRAVLQTYRLPDDRLAAADVNGDGRRNASDYLFLKRVVMGKASFEEPYVYTDGGTPRHKTAVSAGKPYTVSIQASENYPDVRNSELTNGLLAARSNTGYTADRLVGFPAAKAPFDVTVDLGSSNPGLYAFDVSYLASKEAGIGPLGAVAVSVSDDGEFFRDVGECAIPPYEKKMQNAVLTLEKPLQARYVRFQILGEAYWVFLDEVTVFADVPNTIDEEVHIAKVERLYASDRFKTAQTDGPVPDRTKRRTDVASGRSYVLSVSPEAGFEDEEGTKLTDGKTGSDSEADTWIALDGRKETSAVIDLGAVRNDLAAFEAHAATYTFSGAEFPAKITVSVSTDGRSWTDVGRVYPPLPSSSTVFTYAIELERAAEGRYVRFTFAESGCDRILIDELAAFAYTDAENEFSAVYPPVNIPYTEDEFWQGSAAELKKERNLLSGLPVAIALPGSAECTDPASNTPSGSMLLTDGQISASYNIHNGMFVKFRGDACRLLYFDLQKTVSVQSFRLSFIHVSGWAIHLPKEVSFYLSKNGVDWYRIGSAAPATDLDQTHVDLTFSTGSPTSARYLCIRMDVSGWVGLDEIEAFGTRGILPETRSPETAYPKADPEIEGPAFGWALPSPDLLGGAGDIFLAYHNESAPRTEDDLLYQVAYCDENGNILDTMFDGVLFLMAGGFPSGLGGGTGGILHYDKSDVEWMLRSLFSKNRNVGALESAVGKVKKALSLPDGYKVVFYLSLYLPSCDDFGDVDGDGISEEVGSVEGKLKVLRWVLEQTEAELKNHSYENIAFGGYYWYNESMASDGSDVPLLNALGDDIRALGRQIFWIPYYSANGWSEWRAYGLDSACLQPNYAFSLTIPESRLELAAKYARTYGMSVEIEMDARSLTDTRYLDRYFAYLESGKNLGFIECLHLYYMSSGSLSRFACADSPLQRLLYENTYHFIKKDLQTVPETPEGKTFGTSAGVRLNGKAGDNDGTYLYRLFLSPKHGTVSLEEDGSFTYYPDAGFTGEDSFCFTVSRHMGYSEPAEIVIRVS